QGHSGCSRSDGTSSSVEEKLDIHREADRVSPPVVQTRYEAKELECEACPSWGYRDCSYDSPDPLRFSSLHIGTFAEETQVCRENKQRFVRQGHRNQGVSGSQDRMLGVSLR